MAGSRPTSGAAARRRPEAARGAPWLALGLTLGALGRDARADEGLHGRFEFQDALEFSRADSLTAQSAGTPANDVLANLRLTWEPVWGPWSFMAHYLLTFDNGPDVSTARAEADLVGTPPRTWLTLGNTFIDRGATQATQGLDRLALGYTAPDFVVRLGRQALTWGSGLVFRPMDLFDPFAPNATDTEYKPGTDMLYAQILFGSGSDLQLVAVPRAAQPGGTPSAGESSFALHLHTTLFGHATTWLLARDYGDWVGALAVNGALHESTWNLELVPTFEAQGATRVSAVANISDALTLGQRSATVFAEYFRNGFGVAGGRYDLAALPPDLIARLARGQLFETRRDYLAAGATLQMTPLLELSPLCIAGLDDGSVYLLLSSSYSLSDNLTLIGGAQAPLGRSHSEFGGMPLSPESPTVLAPPDVLYLQLRRYF
jgi:hypothetical protein